MWYPATAGARVVVPVNSCPSDPWFTWKAGTVIAAPRGPRLLVKIDGGSRFKALKVSVRPVVASVPASTTLAAREWLWGEQAPNSPMRCMADAMKLARR